MPTCPSFNPLGPYLSNMLGFLDCHSLGLAQKGYLALAGSAMFGAALSGLLAIFVALVGYRVMLTGHVSIRDAVSWMARIGVVLALALSWSAYQPLVYNLVIGGPHDLASTALSPEGLGADDPLGLAVRIDAVNAELAHVLHPERDQSQSATPTSPGAASDQQAVPIAPTGLSVAEREALTSATNDLTVSAIAGEGSVRIVVALMLALGPLFAASLLFDVSRGLFLGWLRTLAVGILAAVVVPAVLSFELAVIEPQVVDLVSLSDAARSLGALPEHIFATAAAFALVMLFGLAGAAYAGAALAGAAARLPSRLQFHSERMLASVGGAAPAVAQAQSVRAQESKVERDRVQIIADAARAMERRDHPQGFAESRRAKVVRGETQQSSGPPMPLVPLGRIGQRERIRHSAAADRRDQKR